MLFKVSFLLIFSLIFISPPTLSKSMNNDQQRANQSQKTISSKQAINIVKRRYGGKVLKIKRININGETNYKVKLLKKNGHIVSVLVNAKTGRIQG